MILQKHLLVLRRSSCRHDGIVDLEHQHRRYARSRDPRLREQLILHHQRLVKVLAARFVGAGESLEDLVQVGSIGLIHALDRYDPGQNVRFSTYATPTILGHIRRHLRDQTSAIKVPRGLQELRGTAERAARQLGGELGRAPRTAEVAARLGVAEERVAKAIESGKARNPLSLSAPVGFYQNGDLRLLIDNLGGRDAAVEAFQVYGDVHLAVTSLEQRPRQIIVLRYFEQMSQAKIGQLLNLSQVHVARLERHALARLREWLTDER